MRLVALLSGTISVVFLSACSSGPTGPQKGTVAYDWAAAKSSFIAGDYTKTSDNLEKVLKEESEFKALAVPWVIVVNAGMAHGYMEIADAFEAGIRANKANPTQFRRQMNNDRHMAKGLVLQYADRAQRFVKANQDAEIKLAFPFPDGSYAAVPLLARVSAGVGPGQQEIEDAHLAVLRRGMILETSRAVGAGDDASKGRQLFASGEAKVSRADFLMAMAAVLHEQALVFGVKKLDEPDKLKLICQQALDVLKGAGANKATKDLTAQIEKDMKAPRPRP